MADLVVKTLGTVSPFCYKNKNCPGFLVKYGDQNILLDCGNGITRLLDLRKDLDNLTIFISHLHPDHYGDLVSLLQAIMVYKKHGLFGSDIKLYIPTMDTDDEYVTIEDKEGWPMDYLQHLPSRDIKLIQKYAEMAEVKITPYELFKYDYNVGDISIQTSTTRHPGHGYCFKIQTESGTVAYSGDTGPTDNLNKIAKDADLFICESTFLKGQYREADNHLYAYEAAQIAKNSNVQKLLLTHFWPYTDKKKYVEEAKMYFENTEAAIEGKEIVLRRKNNG